MTKSYLKISVGGCQNYNCDIVLFQKRYCRSAIFKKIYFTKDALIAIYQIFLNSWRFKVSRCTSFSSCAVIVIFTLCIHFYIFQRYTGYKVKKVDQKFITAYGSPLVKFFHRLTDNETLKHEWIENTNDYNLRLQAPPDCFCLLFNEC